MRIIQIAAINRDGAIGSDGTMPWGQFYKEDLNHFKQTTKGYPVLMGRKTYESLPFKPLPGRDNIVLTSSKNTHSKHNNLHFVNNIHRAIMKAKRTGSNKVFIMGGGNIYKKFMKYSNELIITRIPEDGSGDVYYPCIPNYYVEASRTQLSDDLFVDTYVNSLTCGLGFNLSISNFHEVNKIWKEKLWPGRKSEILPTSSMLYGGGYDTGIHDKAKPMFWCITDKRGKVVAVNSAHATDNNALIRSRGLYVMPEYRGLGLSKTLLAAVIDWAAFMGYQGVWSMPRKGSEHSYFSMGFDQTTDWFDDNTVEFGPNCYAYRDVKIF